MITDDRFPRLSAWEKPWLPLVPCSQLERPEEAREWRATLQKQNAQIACVADGIERLEMCSCELAVLAEKEIVPAMDNIAEEVSR